MPESRDRLSRPVDVAEMFRRRRHVIGDFAVLLDEAVVDPGTPFRWGATPMTDPFSVMPTAVATRGRGGGGPARRGGGSRTPRAVVRRGQDLHRRASPSVLPSWYPRTPLRDITAVVRAIERRRARLGLNEGQEIGSPAGQYQDAETPSTTSSSDAQLEHDPSLITPKPFAAGKKSFQRSVGKVLLDITKQNTSDDAVDCLTPQKKLMNNIDTVQKVVKEELKRLKNTPAAKRAERNQKVRTLMSMR